MIDGDLKLDEDAKQKVITALKTALSQIEKNGEILQDGDILLCGLLENQPLGQDAQTMPFTWTIGVAPTKSIVTKASTESSYMITANMVYKKLDQLFRGRETNPKLQRAYNKAVRKLVNRVTRLLGKIPNYDVSKVDLQYILDFYKRANMED